MHVPKLIQDAHSMLNSSEQGCIQDLEMVRRWKNELILLRSLGEVVLKPWMRQLTHIGNLDSINNVQGPLAALETVKYAIDNGLLTSYRDLVMAEAFADLYKQGEYLLSEGYLLAAGVIFRAVLEEKLRELCITDGCMPIKKRPTIEDLNQELYKCKTVPYDKTMMLNVTSLAAVGNDAAHNNKPLDKKDVERLMNGTLEFITRYSPK